MSDSATTPTAPSKAVQLIDEYDSLASFLFQTGNELRQRINKQLETEQDEAVRIRLFNDLRRVETMMDLGR